MKNTENTPLAIARIHESIQGWHVSDDRWDYLDERSPAHKSRRAAISAARDSGYVGYLRPSGSVARL
jgi:hypothetical protein